MSNIAVPLEATAGWVIATNCLPAYFRNTDIEYDVPETYEVDWNKRCTPVDESSVTKLLVEEPFGAVLLADATVAPVLLHDADGWFSLCNTKFVLASSINNPRLASVTWSWSKRAPYTAAVVVGM